MVVNDDGIEAAGIHKLAEALTEAGDVYVCSPYRQQSASGHGITIRKPVYFEDVPFAEAKNAIAMEGTPADCVKIGLNHYRNRGIEMDMVFSGINHGMNLGTDTIYSGTVAAAVEGSICGLPAAAMSICTNFSIQRAPDHYDIAMKLARQIAESELFSKRIGEDHNALDINFIYKEHVILNVNVPDLPPEEIKGVKVCPLSYQAYIEWYQEEQNDEGRVGYHYSGAPKEVITGEANDSDIVANRLGYATVTPLCFDLTKRNAMETWRRFGWEL